MHGILGTNMKVAWWGHNRVSVQAKDRDSDSVITGLVNRRGMSAGELALRDKPGGSGVLSPR